jgi:hypothetical protein
LEGCGAGLVAEVGVGVRPFLVQGAVESLHFVVGLRPVRPGPFVLDLITECFGE